MIPGYTRQNCPTWLFSVIPGLGQRDQRRALTSVWMAGTLAAYVLYWPAGLLIHAACLLDAYRYHKLRLWIWSQLLIVELEGSHGR